VTHQTLQPETSDDFIPRGGIPQRCRRDHATTRAGYESLVTIPTGYEALKSWAQRIDDRNRSLAATFRRLGHLAAASRIRLSLNMDDAAG
jgi:hypothetical protein